MRTVTATELRQRLGEMLDAASAGETILIERDHMPLAYLVSYEDGDRLVGRGKERIAGQLQALDALVEFSKGWHRERGPEPDAVGAAEWVRWDRDHRDDAE